MVESHVSKINSPISQFVLDKVTHPNFTQHCSNVAADGKSQLIIYHQNIQGLKNKTNEFTFTLNKIKSHFICLSEHHLKLNELNITHSTNWVPFIVEKP